MYSRREAVNMSLIYCDWVYQLKQHNLGVIKPTQRFTQSLNKKHYTLNDCSNSITELLQRKSFSKTFVAAGRHREQGLKIRNIQLSLVGCIACLERSVVVDKRRKILREINPTDQPEFHLWTEDIGILVTRIVWFKQMTKTQLLLVEDHETQKLEAQELKTKEIPQQCWARLALRSSLEVTVAKKL